MAMMSDVIELAEGGGRLVDVGRKLFSISEVVEAVGDMVRPIADEKGLKVRIVSPDADRRVGHRSALSRVLLNLTINAIKSTDEGYVEIAAGPSAELGVPFSVRDTGRGITPAAFDTLVYPLRPSRTRSESLLCERGLGLNICQKLLGAMGSELEVETRPGWGTRFHFQLDLPLSSAPPFSQGPEEA
jgi:signal transduction histidine kinase